MDKKLSCSEKGRQKRCVYAYIFGVLCCLKAMVLSCTKDCHMIGMFSWWMYRGKFRRRRRSVSFKKYVDLVLYDLDIYETKVS